MAEPTLEKEWALWQQGFALVAGLDEAGRGAWAGPVVAAAVILPLDRPDLLTALQGVRDSKELTPRQREEVFELIRKVALTIGVGVGSHTCIDRGNIISATRHAMSQAIVNLKLPPHYLLIDALALPHLATPQLAFPKADALSLSVASASVVAKVTRDRLMILLDQRYPGYQFARHKGYGTKAHRLALTALGPCKIHRRSFAPIKLLRKNDVWLG